MVRRKVNQNKIISAKEIMAKYNISYQTLNHYTDFGLLTVISKIKNVRLYDRGVVDKHIKKIRSLIREGYSLHLIRKQIIGI